MFLSVIYCTAINHSYQGIISDKYSDYLHTAQERLIHF